MYVTVSTLNPTVGIVFTDWSNFNLYKMVVLPAASRPSMRILISLLPNTLDKILPMFAFRPLPEFANFLSVLKSLSENPQGAFPMFIGKLLSSQKRQRSRRNIRHDFSISIHFLPKFDACFSDWKIVNPFFSSSIFKGSSSARGWEGAKKRRCCSSSALTHWFQLGPRIRFLLSFTTQAQSHLSA